MKRIKGIRKRWMMNSISVVLFIVLLAVASFSAAMGSYYYTTMSNALRSKAEGGVRAIRTYQSESRYYQYARSVVSDAAGEQLEVEFIDAIGLIRFSSSDLTAFRSPGTPDIAKALSEGKTQVWIGSDPSTGEHILAASAPLTINGRVMGAMRYVTSLKNVDRQIIIIIAMALGIGLVILAIVYFSNLYFVTSIVDPVLGITDVAKRIAAGSYGVQIEKRYDDEIGDLTDALNDMSLKISQNEKMKSEFISSVSHELRTPLTAINGWGETILDDGLTDDPEQLRRGIRVIVNESRRLSNMVEELLEFSKMEDGRFTLQIEDVDLQAELEDAIFTYQELFRQDGIALEYHPGDGDLPLIRGDSERLKQVFCNVLDNAAKHGGAGRRIDAAVDRDEERIRITVRDYGPGIPDEELPFVKQKFYKGSSKARGSGIGLAVCDEIIRLHDGSFGIDNAEGGGCVVTITLPAA